MTAGDYALAALAVTLFGLAKSGLSGLGALAVPLLSLAMPPLQAAAITLPILIVQDSITVYAFRHEIDRRNLVRLMPGAVVGVAAAFLFASRLSEDLVRLALGLVSVVFVGLTLWRDRLGDAPPTQARFGPGLFWGAASGFASFVSHSGGPPFLIYVVPQRLPPMAFAGTSAVFFAALNLMKLPPYVWLGQFSREGLGVSLIFAPLAVLSTLAGVWVVRRVPQSYFYALVLVATLALGVLLIFNALRALGA